MPFETQKNNVRRDHAALSGAPGPPPARFVARLLSAIDYRPVVLELLDNRFPADVRETAAAALRVAEMGSAAAFAAIVPTGTLPLAIFDATHPLPDNPYDPLLPGRFRLVADPNLACMTLVTPVSPLD